MSRPSDHIDSPVPAGLSGPRLGPIGYARFFWRQLTSMRTALVLLLLLAIAAVPGSLVPQRSSDPNGVTQYFDNNPDLAPVLDAMQLFDVYTSAWFSSIYLLLFISLIGCVLPRTAHHLKALRTAPPRTPARLERLAGFTSREVEGADATSVIDSAHQLLRSSGYRVERFTGASRQGVNELSVSAERGYLRETGNLVFHTALIGVLLAVGIGGSFGYNGQKVVVEGQSFVNVLAGYDSFSPGRFFDEGALDPYRFTLESLDVEYEEQNLNAYGAPIDFRANLTTHRSETVADAAVRVNEPLAIGGTHIYLLGNGYAPTVTVRDGKGNIAYTASVPFLPQDSNLTSVGVIKAPDAVPEQLGMIGFFYPTARVGHGGAFTSIHPDLLDPLLTLRVYTGDLGLDDGVPKSVYSLDTDGLIEIVGGESGVESIELKPGETAKLPDGLGSVTLENVAADPESAGDGDWSGSVHRFASFDVHHDPSQLWVLSFAILVVAGLLTSLFIPRRRVWVKAVEIDGGIRLEYAGLARGEDPGLESAVADIARRHGERITT